jgi:hypothetical protein
MKKLILVFALACFVAFGTLGVQKTLASTDNVEIVNMNLDDDPEKNKKADGKDKKDAKVTSTKKCADAKECKTKCETKCQTKTKCCPTKEGNKECKEKEGGDKK